MTGQTTRASRKLLVFALLLPAAAATAQEVVFERAITPSPGAPFAVAPVSASLPAPLSTPALPSLLAPSAEAPVAIPAALPPAAAAAAAADTAEPARPADDRSPTAKNRAQDRGAAAPTLAPRLNAPAQARAARGGEYARESADAAFVSLTGERLIAVRGKIRDSATPLVAPAAGARLAPRASPRSRLSAALPAILAAGLPALHPSPSGWQFLSDAGYLVGNVGAAIFPLVQIHDTYRTGKAAPRARAIVGAAASLALGLVSATILHKALWGIQNVFGGLCLLAPLLIGARRARGGALAKTALLALTAAGLGAAIYAAAAATIPAALGAALSAPAVSRIATLVQSATSAMFLWMFLPDTVKALRGRAAGGFSPGFNLMFFVSSLGSMLWAAPAAWIAAGPDQLTYRMIFAVNAVYALASFLSFRLARRAPKPAAK